MALYVAYAILYVIIGQLLIIAGFEKPYRPVPLLLSLFWLPALVCICVATLYDTASQYFGD